MSSELPALKRLYDTLLNYINKFVKVVLASSIVGEEPFTFCLPEQFTSLGRRLWPDILDTDTLEYESLTKQFLDVVNSADNNKKVEEDEEEEEKIRNLLAKYPDWNRATLNFISYMFKVHNKTGVRHLTISEFRKMTINCGDTSPKLAFFNKFEALAEKTASGEYINLNEIYEFMYTCTSSKEKLTTLFKNEKNHLRHRVKDLAFLSDFISSMEPENKIQCGLC